MKRTVLTFVGGYLPGFRYGGPVRSVSNIVEQLGDEFRFRIVTTDRDYLSKEPYEGIKSDDWNTVGKAQVFYSSARTRSLTKFTRLIRETPHDVLYLNSFFDPVFTFRPLLARRFGWLDDPRVVIAPRGEFSKGALAIKGLKKMLFLKCAPLLGLYRDVIWHASTELERHDILAALGVRDTAIIIAAPDITPVDDAFVPQPRSRGGRLKIVFLSRIDKKKNLDFLVRVLAKVAVEVELNIFGPIQDPTYWKVCQSLIAALPAHISANYLGSVRPENVCTILAQHDLFVLPTRGENFGHVIWEALHAGTPVIVSDQTPWTDDGLGGCTVIPLSDENTYVTSIERVARATRQEATRMREAARAIAREFVANSGLIERTKALFLNA